MKAICDISVTSAPWRSRSWSPAALFAGGVQGAWFDPSDVSTLFQDSAGTIPVTAPGQAVGRMLDKSANGHHAVQASSTARPIYRLENGRHWLEFDGVDDRMVLVAPLNMNAGQIIMGLIEPTGVSEHSGLVSASTSGYIAITGSGAARSLGKSNGAVINRVDTPGFFPMTDKSAVAIRIDTTTIYARLPNSQSEFHNAVPAAANLNASNTLMAFSSSGQLPARVDLYGLILLTSVPASGDLENGLSFVNARMPA